jgi:hypothetical protein
MDDVTKCSGTNCTFIIDLKNNDNRTWVGNDVNVSSLVSYTTVCHKGSVTSTKYYCEEKNLTVACDGIFDGTILSRCTFRVTKPSCEMLTVSSDETMKCSVLSFDSTSTKCQCVVTFTRFASFNNLIVPYSNSI